MVDNMYNFTLVFTHFLSLLRRSSKHLQFCLGCVSLIGKLRNFTWFVARLFAKHAILRWLFEHSSQPVQFYLGFCTFNVICHRSSQHLQFYLGCLSIVDKLCTFTWFGAHFSRKVYFYPVVWTSLATCASLHWFCIFSLIVTPFFTTPAIFAWVV